MNTPSEKLVNHGNHVVEKMVSIATLALLVAFTVKLGAIFPFMDSDLTSNATLIGVALALFVPLLASIITGPLWVHAARRRAVVQLAISIFAVASCTAYVWDMAGYTEWMGTPVVEQLGLHYVYSFYPVIVYLSASFSSFLVSGSGLFVSSLETVDEGKNDVLVMATILVGLSWLDIWLLSMYGPLWSLVAEMATHGTFVAIRVWQLAGIHQQVAAGLASGLLEWRRNHDSFPAIIKNGRNGLLHGFKGFFAFIIAFGLAIGAGVIVSNVLIRASFVPLWLEFFPALLATGIVWGLFYRAFPRRVIMMLASAGLLAITGAILQAQPYALLDLASLVTWLIAAAFSGVLLSCMLHARSMAIGRFSQPFWGFGITFFLGGGFLMVMLFKWDYFCTECFQIATYVGLVTLALVAAGWAFGQFPGFWNKGKRELQASGIAPDYSNFSALDAAGGAPRVAVPSRPGAMRFARMARALAVLAVVAGLVVTGGLATARVSSASNEHVLGCYGSTSGTDYYLWHADSLRNIDMNYRPDLPSSPVNSTARITLARGEHEGFQVVLTPWRLKSLNVISLAPTGDLVRVGSPTDRIGLGNITTFMVDYVPQLAYQYPDRLLPFKPIDTSYSLHGRHNWPFYIDVGVPADDTIEPGTYRTTMRFHCSDYHDTPPGITRAYVDRDVSFTLEVQVYNFTVPVERHVATEIIWGIPDSPAWHQLYADHRLDWYFAPRALTAVDLTPGSLSITFDWPAYLAQLGAAFAGGMKYFPVAIVDIPGLRWGSLELTADEETVFSWYLSNLTACLSTNFTPWGTPYLDHAYYFIQDEPGIEIYPGIIRIAQLIHQYAPGLKVMETMNQDLYSYPDAFLADVDIYCFHIHQWEPSATLPDHGNPDGWPVRIKDYLETSYTGPREKELWVYHTHNHFPTTDTDVYMQGILQRNSFWLHWTYGVPGWLYWSFNWGLDGNVGGYGYAHYGESVLVGWGEEGDPVGSLRLERVRDGIEDYEYFWLLNSTISVLEGSGYATEAAAARDLLGQVDDMYDRPGYIKRLPLADTHDEEPAFRWSYEPMAAPYLLLRHEIGTLLGQIGALGLL